MEFVFDLREVILQVPFAPFEFGLKPMGLFGYAHAQPRPTVIVVAASGFSVTNESVYMLDALGLQPISGVRKNQFLYENRSALCDKTGLFPF